MVVSVALMFSISHMTLNAKIPIVTIIKAAIAYSIAPSSADKPDRSSEINPNIIPTPENRQITNEIMASITANTPK